MVRRGLLKRSGAAHTRPGHPQTAGSATEPAPERHSTNPSNTGRVLVHFQHVAITKKISLIGAPGVGKTSLVRRFVHSLFSERYLTTVGVCIEKKLVSTPMGDVGLVLWDLAGDDELQRLQASYLRGTAAYLLVVDGTQPDSLRSALELQQRVVAAVGSSVPFVVALNKADLTEHWKITEELLKPMTALGWQIFRTSAKEGAAVEVVFNQLALLSSQQ